MPCVSIRYLILSSISLVGFIAYFNRSNVSIAIVSMVNRPNVSSDHPNLCPNPESNREKAHGNDHRFPVMMPIQLSHLMPVWISGADETWNEDTSKAKYDWSQEMQGIVMASFYYSYFALQIPAGYVVSRFGSRIPIIISSIATAIISIASPFAADGSVYAFIALRILLGIVQAVVFPAVFVLVCSWFPVRERSTAIILSYSGVTLSSVVISFSSGYLINALTWRAMFFLPGIVSLILSVILLLLVRNRPEDHCLVTPEELATIRGKIMTDETAPLLDANENPVQEVATNEAVVKDPIPWKQILTNKSVLSFLFFRMSRSNYIFLISSEMPTYLVTVLNMDIVTMGIIVAVHSAIQIVTGITSARVSEALIERSYCTRTNARKLFSICSGFLDSVFLMLVPAFRCNLLAVLIAYNVSALLGGFSAASDGPLAAEMSTKFHGMLFAMGNFMGTIPGFVAPMASGFILQNVSNQWHAWEILFYTSGLLVILSNILYLSFASAERQSFDFSPEEREQLRSATRYNSVN